MGYFMGYYGSLYSNTVIGTLDVDGWAVTFGTKCSRPPINGHSLFRFHHDVSCRTLPAGSTVRRKPLRRFVPENRCPVRLSMAVELS